MRQAMGAIFDMDGVLLDNLEFHMQAFQAFGREEGRNLRREEIETVFGRRNEEMLTALLDRKLSADEAQRFEQRKEQIYRDLIRPTLQQHVVPGLKPFLRELAAHDFRLAVATSGPGENVEMVLRELALEKTFDAVVTGSDVTRGKPHPEAFLTAAERLRIDPEDCVVFEDSASGVKAALAARCRCVALATTHSREELEPLAPHLIVSDFDTLTVERVSQLIRAGK